MGIRFCCTSAHKLSQLSGESEYKWQKRPVAKPINIGAFQPSQIILWIKFALWFLFVSWFFSKNKIVFDPFYFSPFGPQIERKLHHIGIDA